MKSFFSEEDFTESVKTTTARTDMDMNCIKCGLKFQKECDHPKMEPTGEGKQGVLIIGEAPGINEDEQGIQFIGRSGTLLRDKLKQNGLDLDRDFWKINSINCCPYSKTGIGGATTRKPTKNEIAYCKPYVDSIIKQLNPKMIWLVGGVAVTSFLSDRFRDCSISRWRKLLIKDRHTNSWVIPLFHPSYIMRDDKNENLKAIYDRDMEWACSRTTLERPVFEDWKDKVKCLYNISEICQVLDKLYEQTDRFFFDFETTGLKPYKPGHKILTISFAVNCDEAFSFPYQYRDFFTEKERRAIKTKMRKILSHQCIDKIAQNIKFEGVWSKKFFGVTVFPWKHDTMVTAHVEDSRKKYTSLNFQLYTKFGIDPYDKHLEKYKSSKGKEFNTLENVELHTLLQYSGTDSLGGMKLYNDQMISQGGLVGEEQQKIREANNLFKNGLVELIDIQNNGIRIDEKWYKEKDVELNTKIASTRHKLIEGEDGIKFKNKTGKVIDLNSTKDLGILFYDILKHKEIKTEKGNRSVSEATLSSMKSSFVKKLLSLRNLEKIKGTYLAQFERELCGDKIHPFIDLHIPGSYRSSSSYPNFQNIPVRDEYAKMVCRGGIIPSPGNKLLDADWKGIEVCIAACYTKDSTLIKYIEDPDSDMHRDESGAIWNMPNFEVTKDIRFYTKNGWVFPEFYGSYYGNCAKSLWAQRHLKNKSGVVLSEHLKSVGIKDYFQFEEHLRKLEKIFWYEKFNEYREWKITNNEEYQKKGYVELLHGFRRGGYLTPNQVNNTPPQGTAFHCLLWTMIEVNKKIKREKLGTKIIGQIHDDIVFDLRPEEEQYIIEMVDYYGTQAIRERYDWLIVPLKIEYEVTEIDGRWHEKREAA